MAELQGQASAPSVLIQTFNAPRLDIEDARDPEKKRAFLLSYRSYVAKCETADATGLNVQKVSLLSCLDEAVVNLILAIGDIRDAQGVTVLEKEAISAPLLEAWLDPVTVATEKVTKAELKTKLSAIKWRFNIKFAEAVSMLAGDIYLELVKTGYKELLTDETTTKWLTLTFRDKIGFGKFKEDFSTKLLRDEEIEKDWIRTIRTAQDLAAGYDVHVENKLVEKSSTSSKPKEEKKDGKAAEKSKKRKTVSAEPKKHDAPLCLNLETCEGERHYVKDCPKTSEELKKTLLNEYKLKKEKEKELREQKKKKRINAVLRRNLAKDTTKFFIQAQLLDAQADSGSAVTVCPTKLVTQLRTRGVKLSVKSIPRRSYRVADDTQSLSVSQEVVIPKLTMLSGGNTIELANVRMFVSDDVPLVLLGRALLNEMGFSFNDFLQRKGHMLNGRDMQHVSPEEDDMASGDGLYVASLDRVEGEDESELEQMEASLPSKAELDDWDSEFELMVAKAREGPHGEELEHLVRKYRDVFSSDFTSTPANVSPMKVVLKEAAEPAHTPARRYRPDQKKFLEETFEHLVDKGILQKVESATWLSAPHLVAKPLKDGSQTFRLTIDLRSINLCTEPERQCVPTVEDELVKFAGCKYFSNLDLSNCFWQFPLCEEARQLHGIVAPSGVYLPTRVLHGAKNASIYTQRVLSQVFAHLSDHVSWYLDDALVFARSKEVWLEKLEAYLKTCQKLNLKLSPKKCELFASEIVWCGRRISADGIMHEPRRLQALKDMPLPANGAQLQQYLASLNWMRLSIPEYERKARPLQQLLKATIRRAGSAKSSVLKRFDIVLGDEQVNSFHELKHNLEHRIKLAHFDPEGERYLALHTDASCEGWAGILTSVPFEQEDLPPEQQHHEPIAFMSGSFTETQQRWSTIEQEAFAIITSMERMKAWTLATKTRIHTDSRNVVFIYKPVPSAVATRLGLSNVAVSKLARWGLRLSAFDYSIKHRKGEENVFPDLLSRWGRAEKRVMLIRKGELPSKREFCENFFEDLRKAQQEAGLTPKERGLRWVVPESARALVYRILAVAHGAAEHRSKKNTSSFIKDLFVWKGMDDDIAAFVEQCILCCKTRSGERNPRKIASLLHAEHCNELLHFDFLYMHEGHSPYLLLLKDDFSGFCLLYRCGSSDSESVVEALSAWIGMFGVPKLFHSDTASHFKNEVMEELARKLKIEHTFAVAYAPWSNGSVERLCRSVLAVFRRICSQQGRAYECWANYVLAVQRVLNTRKAERLMGRSPAEVFTNAKDADSSLAVMLEDERELMVMNVAEELLAKNQEEVEKMFTDVDLLHKGIREKLDEQRQKAVDAHNRKTGIRDVDFTKGDYVLVGIPDFKKKPKLALRWNGPARVLDFADHALTYEVQFLGQEAISVVHASRLKHYADGDLHVTEELEQHLEDEAVAFYVVEEIQDVRENENGLVELLVKWEDFVEKSWEPIQTLYRDCPEVVRTYVMALKAGKFKNRLRRLLK